MLEMIDEPVRVAHDYGFPPFAEVKDGKSEGLAVDIFRAAAAWAGINVKFRARFLRAEMAHFGLWQMGALMHTSGVGELKPQGLQYISQHMADASLHAGDR
jgi:hypothetical protein